MSRALVIACQYATFPKNRLFGCFNDADAFINRIRKMEPNIKITYMRDDLARSNPLFPDVRNIIRELNSLSSVKETKLFFYYSGHGSTTKDGNNDEATILRTTNGSEISIMNGMNGDSCIVCYSGKNLVLFRDDDFYFYISRLRADQTLFGFSDSCNSGTLFDLCYVNVGSYTGEFSTYDISGLLLEMDKCKITSSFYPDKINKTKANVIFISGTRDKDMSYEVLIDKKACGIFTHNLCKILDYGVKDMTLRQFYYLIISAINWDQQVPVMTFSKDLNVDTFKMDVFKYLEPINWNKMKLTNTGKNIVTRNIKKVYKNKK